MAKQRFHTRSFISFLLFISIIWLLVSGTVLYIAPPGRVAHWQHWTLFGFSKDQWQAQHTIFSYVFVVLAIIHVFSLNWRNLWSYVKLKSTNGFRKKKEFIGALVISFIVFFGTSFELPPFISFFDLGESIGSTWEDRLQKAPIPHTENLSLNEISTNYSELSADELIELLENDGIEVLNKSQTLKEIAIQNNTAPSALYSIISSGSGKGQGNNNSGKGFGRLTIKELAIEINTEVEEILMVLNQNNLGGSANSTIREIASENGLHPSEVMKLIRGEH